MDEGGFGVDPVRREERREAATVWKQTSAVKQIQGGGGRVCVCA